MAAAETTVSLASEELTVDTRSVLTGRVRVATKTEFVEEMASAELASSEVEVLRVPVDRPVEKAPEIRTEGDVTIIPVLEEVLVVEKRLVLKEELHVRRRAAVETVETPVLLRKQRAVVTRQPGDAPTHPARNMTMEATSSGSDHSRTITAFFDSRDHAQAALDRLDALGLPAGSAKLVRGNDADVATDDNENRGFWESLSDFFFPDDDRAAYAEGLRRGGFLVTASNIPADRYDEALDILDDEGSVDVDARTSEWRSEGWTGSSYGDGTPYAADTATDLSMAGTGVGTSAYSGAKLSGGASGYDADRDMSTERAGTDTWRSESASAAPIASDASYDAVSSRAAARTGDEEIIPVVEERLRVGKRDADLGRVRVRSYTVSEPVSEDVNLRSERVFVERRPVDRALTGDEAAFTDRTIEATEHAEEAVVSKDARITEEVSLRRESEERTETVSDTVRRTEVEIEDEREAEIRRREGTSGDFERR